MFKYSISALALLFYLSISSALAQTTGVNAWTWQGSELDSLSVPQAEPNCSTGYCNNNIGSGGVAMYDVDYLHGGGILYLTRSNNTITAYVQKNGQFTHYIELHAPQGQTLEIGKVYKSHDYYQPVYFYPDLTPHQCPTGSRQANGFFVEKMSSTTGTVVHYYIACTRGDGFDAIRDKNIAGSIIYRDTGSQNSTARILSKSLLASSLDSAERLSGGQISMNWAWYWFTKYAGLLFNSNDNTKGRGIIALSSNDTK